MLKYFSVGAGLMTYVPKATGRDETAELTCSTAAMVAVAVENQTTALAQVTEGIDQISSVVQTNSATAQESAAASEELSAEASGLKQLVDGFALASD